MTAFWISIGVIAAFCVLFLFLIFPSVRRHNDREMLKGMLIAHRGLHSDTVPENSISAFAYAVAHGYAIENDIHITADGEVVVFHDATLERMCGVKGRVEEMTLSYLRECRLNGSDERIPTLKECLATVDGKVPLLIEFKCGPFSCKRLCQAADKILSEYKGKYFIQSFYPGVPAWYKRHRKEVLRGQLMMAYKGKNVVRQLISCFICNVAARPDFVAYDIKGANSLTFKLQKLLGAFSLGWTFRSKSELDSLYRDFDAYIFENFIPDKKE